jgi:hypothetical protein
VRVSGKTPCDRCSRRRNAAGRSGAGTERTAERAELRVEVVMRGLEERR